MSENLLKIGVVTVSDRAHQGIYEDQGGPVIIKWLRSAISSPIETIYQIVPDEQTQIEAMLKKLSDRNGCHLILTTGGTGPAKRDVTPEATLAVADKVLDGFGERMRSISLQYAPTAILSRQMGVVRDECLIVNLPGKPKAIKEILDELFEAIPDCLELIDGPVIETNPEIVTAFRPHSDKKK